MNLCDACWHLLASPLRLALALLLLVQLSACSRAPQPTSSESPRAGTAASQAQDCVILLHGLARTHASMQPLADALQAQSYWVINNSYPSRDFPIARLAELAIAPALASCRARNPAKVHFVTHSLGGILVRQYLSHTAIPELGRVVMLAPPNKGSEIVDSLKNLPPFGWINGPAGRELGTAANDLPQRLGPVDFELGVIAGTASINWILSLYLPNPDDGKVSVASTRIAGMRDFIALPIAHPFMMKDARAITQIVHFLAQGQFLHAAPARK